MIASWAPLRPINHSLLSTGLTPPGAGGGGEEEGGGVDEDRADQGDDQEGQNAANVEEVALAEDQAVGEEKDHRQAKKHQQSTGEHEGNRVEPTAFGLRLSVVVDVLQ